MEALPGIIVALLAAVASYAAARYSGRSTVKVKELDVDASAYERAEKINEKAFERLDKEISALHKRIGAQGVEIKTQGEEIQALKNAMARITRIFEVSINFIEDTLLWALGGCEGHMPAIPSTLIEHLAPALVEEHQRQQASPRK